MDAKEEAKKRQMQVNELRSYKSPAAILLMDERQMSWSQADDDTKWLYLNKAKTQAEEAQGRNRGR